MLLLFDDPDGLCIVILGMVFDDDEMVLLLLSLFVEAIRCGMDGSLFSRSRVSDERRPNACQRKRGYE